MANFDEAVIEHPDGTNQQLTYAEFFKLSLGIRVKMLCESRVRFFKAGRLVSATEAMK